MKLVKKDLNDNLKGAIIWLSIISLLIIMILALHPIVVTKMNMMNEMLEQFPKEMINALNLENTNFNNILSYFFYEFQFILLASTIYAGILGANIISKEESDKTIQLLYSKPVSRLNILLNKMIVVILYLLVFNFTLFTVTTICMLFLGNQNFDYLALLNMYLGLLLTQSTFAFIGIAIATLLKKPKSASTITGGIIMVTFILGIVSKIADKVDNLIYLSPVNYLLEGDFISRGHMEIKYMVILFIMLIIAITVSIRRYDRKDFNL
ncbi:MAG: ABC transporter permease subunit [Bacilli bacterium]|nr:ABC transporter permease subunit [Bacilli bacterium]